MWKNHVIEEAVTLVWVRIPPLLTVMANADSQHNRRQASGPGCEGLSRLDNGGGKNPLHRGRLGTCTEKRSAWTELQLTQSTSLVQRRCDGCPSAGCHGLPATMDRTPSCERNCRLFRLSWFRQSSRGSQKDAIFVPPMEVSCSVTAVTKSWIKVT